MAMSNISGIKNPIGLNAAFLEADELIKLIDVLNPENETQSPTLINRFGSTRSTRICRN